MNFKVHTSGSCDLPVDPEIVNFCYNHLIDIQYIDDLQFKIVFNSEIDNELLNIFQNIKGYIQQLDSYTLLYQNVYEAENKDVTKIIRNINNLLKSERGKHIKSVTETYENYIDNILEVGEIYSSFIEIVLCNMYVAKNGKILRYALTDDINATPHLKLNIKKLHTKISKLLGLLYEPNSMSICKFSDSNDELTENQNTILERLWNGLF